MVISRCFENKNIFPILIGTLAELLYRTQRKSEYIFEKDRICAVMHQYCMQCLYIAGVVPHCLQTSADGPQLLVFCTAVFLAIWSDEISSQCNKMCQPAYRASVSKNFSRFFSWVIFKWHTVRWVKEDKVLHLFQLFNFKSMCVLNTILSF